MPDFGRTKGLVSTRVDFEAGFVYHGGANEIDKLLRQYCNYALKIAINAG